MIETTKHMKSWKESTLMFVGLSRQRPLLDINILSFFIDGFSRKCWIFVMHNKDETFSKFVEFKALVDKDTDMKVKALKRDNGGEYVLNEFKELCEKVGIKRELTSPHNPQ